MLAHIRKELILLLRIFQKSWHGASHRILLATLSRMPVSLVISKTFGRIMLLICLILGLKGKKFKKKIHIKKKYVRVISLLPSLLLPLLLHPFLLQFVLPWLLFLFWFLFYSCLLSSDFSPTSSKNQVSLTDIKYIVDNLAILSAAMTVFLVINQSEKWEQSCFHVFSTVTNCVTRSCKGAGWLPIVLRGKSTQRRPCDT